jgi:hypothetical protein
MEKLKYICDSHMYLYYGHKQLGPGGATYSLSLRDSASAFALIIFSLHLVCNAWISC